jgi:hypothetical protein
VADLLGELEREAARIQQYVKSRHQANGKGASDRGTHLSKPKQEKGQVAPAPKTCEKVTQCTGMEPLPKPARPTARRRKARANLQHVHSLKPVRTIAGLTIADFLYNR